MVTKRKHSTLAHFNSCLFYKIFHPISLSDFGVGGQASIFFDFYGCQTGNG